MYAHRPNYYEPPEEAPDHDDMCEDCGADYAVTPTDEARPGDWTAGLCRHCIAEEAAEIAADRFREESFL